MENKRLGTVNNFLRILPDFSMHSQTLKTYILIFVYTIMILALLMTIIYLIIYLGIFYLNTYRFIIFFLITT